MSKSTSRFVANEKLWSGLRDCVTSGNRVSAAVAYFGQGGAKLLPLKKGDMLVVDMSLGAVRQGVTDPKAVRTLMARGVRVFSRAKLHAKFLIAGGTLIASSANASRNSKEFLDEAGIITNDPAAVQNALVFFDKLCTEPVGKKYLAKCVAEYRPPKFKAAEAPRSHSVGPRRVTEAKMWFIGGLIRQDPSGEDKVSVSRLERRVEKRLTRAAGTEVRWIRFAAKPKFLRGIQVGDWVVDCMKDGGSRYVGPPAQVLGQEEWKSSRGNNYTMLMMESPSHGGSMALSRFRRKIRSIDSRLDHVSPRTKPIENDEHADHILRLWTASGRIAK